MFTNNYIKLQKVIFLGTDTSGFVDCAGNNRSVYMYYAPHYYGNISFCMLYGRCQELNATYATTRNPINGTYSGVYFGSGSTPATKDDYKLESPIISGLTITNSTSLTSQVDVNGQHICIADYILRNTTENEITISEIGAFCPICLGTSYYNSGTSVSWAPVLMDRTVLDEPVTIAPGEAKLVTYTHTVDLPQ